MKPALFAIALRGMLTLSIVTAAPCVGFSAPGEEKAARLPNAAKIKFRLDGIRADGLRGPADGLVAVSYEFCVPADAAIYAEVKRLDPSVQITPGARGRVGCAAGQALCVGNTHQADWRRVLKKLTALGYVKEIRECFFE